MIAALRAEVDFLAETTATTLAIVSAVVFAGVLGKWLHLPVFLTAAVAFLGLAAVGYLAVWQLLERVNSDLKKGVAPQASSRPRYAPIAVQGLIFAFQAALLFYQVFDHTVTGRRSGTELSIMLVLSMALSAYLAWKSARRVRGPTSDLGTTNEPPIS